MRNTIRFLGRTLTRRAGKDNWTTQGAEWPAVTIGESDGYWFAIVHLSAFSVKALDRPSRRSAQDAMRRKLRALVVDLHGLDIGDRP